MPSPANRRRVARAGWLALAFGSVMASVAFSLGSNDVFVGGAVTAAVGAYVTVFAQVGSF